MHKEIIHRWARVRNIITGSGENTNSSKEA